MTILIAEKKILMFEQQPPLLLVICDLAKQKNIAVLKDYVNKIISINFMEGLFTPVMYLAQQGEVEAVDFLINKFDASLDHAVFGYALADNKDKVDELLAMGASQKKALFGYLAIGSSHGESLLPLKINFDIPNGFVNSTDLDDASKKQIIKRELFKEIKGLRAKGYAHSGNKAMVEKIIAESSHFFKEIRNEAVLGYVLSGRIQEAGELIQLGASIDYAVRGSIIAGNVTLTNTLIYYCRGSKDEALRYFAMTGNHMQVKKLLEEGVDKNIAVEGYAEGGYIREVIQLFEEGASKACAIRGYVKGNHITQVNELVLQMDNGRIIAYEEYIKFGSLITKKEILFLLSTTDDEQLRINLLDFFQKKYQWSSEKLNSLLAEAQDLETIIKNRHCSFHEAKAATMLLKKQVNGNWFFDKVCQLAIQGNTQELRHLTEKVSINLSRGFYRPIMLLAKQGNVGAVNFLINNFGGSLDLAVMGYALGGNEEQVNGLLAAGADPLLALTGYAFSPLDCEKKITSLLHSQCLKNEEVYTSLLIEGAAFHGNYVRVKILVKEFQNKPNRPDGNLSKLVAAAILGYAMGGHTEMVAAMHNSKNSKEIFLNPALTGYAVMGLVKEVNNLINADKANFQDHINYVITHYAMGGNFSEVNNLLSRGASKQSAVHGYAWGGYSEKVNEMINISNTSVDDTMISFAMMGYAKGGHIDQINQLVTRGISEETACNFYVQYSTLINPRKILFLLSATKNNQLRKRLAIAFEQRYPNTDMNLIQQKNLCLMNIMKNTQLGFYEAKLFLKPEIIMWLIQGWKYLVEKDQKIKPEDFYYITSLVLSVNYPSVKKARGMVSTYFFDGIRNASPQPSKRKRDELGLAIALPSKKGRL